ncbi:MAG: hypothetical protein EBE86_033640 [Hormoscilla sp. GUM202]|nr:hypothetical protein [Hormoscilla sp. GUM202]
MTINVDKVLIDDWYVVARIQDCPPNSIKQVRLFGEDPSKESQRPVCLPLLSQNNTDTQWSPEVHASCDRASIAYRRWLKKLGITYGVC